MIWPHHRPHNLLCVSVSVSVCLPARNEQDTVGAIVGAIVADLTGPEGLVDEVIVIDDHSTDDTRAAAAGAGAKVFAVDEILPEVGPGTGKGEALWKALYVAKGDVLVYLDADLKDFDTAFVTDLAMPLIDDSRLSLVKANYRRDLDGAPGQGGRVNELVARPLIELFFPSLARIAQPLGGEYAARRHALERVPFVAGYGVDLALLVDIAATDGPDSVTQVDLSARSHRNRSLDDLSNQALTVMRTAMNRAGTPVPTGGGDIVERPPMVEVAAYRALVRRSR